MIVVLLNEAFDRQLSIFIRNANKLNPEQTKSADFYKKKGRERHLEIGIIGIFSLRRVMAR